MRVGRKGNPTILEANAQDLLPDAWTPVGVLAGAGTVALTDWQRLDPITVCGARS